MRSMIVGSALLAASALSVAGAATVTRVIAINDGDTFETQEGERVRMLGIDAPETYQPGGDIARDILGKYLLGRTVRLESDGENKDRYGRILRYVYLGDMLVNGELVRNGYAAFQPKPIPPGYW